MTETEILKNDLTETGKLYMKVSFQLSKKLKTLKAAAFDPERKLWYITKYTRLENVKKIMELEDSYFESWGRKYKKPDPDVVTFPKYIQEDPDDKMSVYDDNFKLIHKKYTNEEVIEMFNKPKEIKQVKQSVVSDFF
jgi:hypothetical protein